MPLASLYKVEHAFARLGRWRRLFRCFEGTEASVRGGERAGLIGGRLRGLPRTVAQGTALSGA